MSGFKVLVNRMMFYVAFSGFIFMAVHELAGFIIVSRYSSTIEQDLVKLAVMVENENVLSTDILGGNSSYGKFVNNVLRSSENYILKYDVEDGNSGIRENTSLVTAGYNGANNIKNPIQIYYKDSRGNNKYIKSYTDCPNRGEVIYIELTGNVYVPVLTTLRQTTDKFSQTYDRRLQKVTKTTTVIGSSFYKGK